MRRPTAQVLSPHHIACRIMRRENFIIAMVNKGVLDLRMTVPLLGRVHLPFTTSLEVNLQLVLLNWMLSDRFTLRRRFIRDPGALRRRLYWFGIANILMTPFILPFLSLYFVFKHAEEFQSKKDYLGPRMWSPLARWQLREFNELPHVFDRRYAASSGCCAVGPPSFSPRTFLLCVGAQRQRQPVTGGFVHQAVPCARAFRCGPVRRFPRVWLPVHVLVEATPCV